MDLAIGTTVVRTILSNPILGAISLQMTWQCVRTLLGTTQEIYGFITTIETTTRHVNIGSLLMELDLASEILYLESMIKEIDIEKNYTQTLAISLKLLQDCLNDIHLLLSEVNKRIEYNKKLWVTGYGIREFKFDDLSNRLKFLTQNLEKRKENLVVVLKINDKLTPLERNSDDYDDELLDISMVTIDSIVTYEKNINDKSKKDKKEKDTSDKKDIGIIVKHENKK